MYPVTSISSHFPLSSISKLRPPARLLIASPAIAQETRKSCWNLRAHTFSYIPHLISWQILGTHPTNEKMFTMNISKSASNVSNFKSIFWMHPPSLYLESASLSFSNVLIFSITKTWTERVWCGTLFWVVYKYVYIYIYMCIYIYILLFGRIRERLASCATKIWLSQAVALKFCSPYTLDSKVQRTSSMDVGWQKPLLVYANTVQIIKLGLAGGEEVAVRKLRPNLFSTTA